MPDLMVDIETLSTANDAAVIAIGLVIFNNQDILDSREILLDPQLSPGSRDLPTLEWWSRQDPGVYRKMTSGTLLPHDACQKFIDFTSLYPVKHLWANAPTFDCVILRSLFKTCGKDFPIHFSKERDFRTLTYLAKRKGISWDSAYANRAAHDAVSDATAQAQAVQIILSQL